MAHRIEIQFNEYKQDTRAQVRTKKIQQDFPKVKKVFQADVYTVSKKFDQNKLHKIADALTNPVIQHFEINQPIMQEKFDYAVEIGCLPGVTDNTGKTAQEITEDMLKVKFKSDEAIYFSQVNYIVGKISQKEAEAIGQSIANTLIQRIHIKSYSQYKKDKGMDIIVPKVTLKVKPKADIVNLDIPEGELIKIGKSGIANKDGSRRGPLALDLKSLKAIKAYFKKQGRMPTDAELESIAQTWSEHCKHTIFANEIDEIKDGLYKHYIQRSTKEIRAKMGKKDFCVSVFKDNSGAIIFDNKWLITDKVETHNSPSALDPYGGAITGIVGVNRDTIGFGKAALPVANRYGYCFASPFNEEPIYRDKELKDKMLSPRRILEGVVAGVNAGGNCSGIPTPQGFVYFHDRYKGKPLVFVGTIGLIPKKINGKPAYIKKAEAGDAIVMIGGKVGADGIHGATFSSESLSSGSPATAVQIGDPYTQKKLSDAIVKEARTQDLYNSITDNGAGGLSSSVGEMAKESGGCEVWLDKVPLKYPGLQPWQIWISEAQERMTVAVPQKKLKKFMDLMKRRGVGAWVIGKYTNNRKCIVKYGKQKVIDLDMEFMHEGNPKYSQKTNWKKPVETHNFVSQPKNFLKMLSDLNNCSFSFISYQYDYEVLGGSCVKPLQGKGQVNSLAAVFRPVLDSKKGVVTSQALYPTYSEIDPYQMSACCVDTAVRNCIAVGGTLDELALLDNFCWCSSTEPERLGQLKEAVKGIYDYTKIYGTPLISGKDSMFNDFKGFDKNGKPLKISIPPTLLVSALGVVPNTDKCITLDAKNVDDWVYVLGETKNETTIVPQVDAKTAIKLYRSLEKAIRQELVASAQSVIGGGIAMALARTAIGGMLGMEISLSENDLYSESQSRLVVTVSHKHKKAFEKLFQGQKIKQIGKVIKDKFIVKDNKKIIVNTTVLEMEKHYRKTFKNF
jgi:phosphoribosylformylglycinamidine synthase